MSHPARSMMTTRQTLRGALPLMIAAAAGLAATVQAAGPESATRAYHQANEKPRPSAVPANQAWLEQQPVVSGSIVVLAKTTSGFMSQKDAFLAQHTDVEFVRLLDSESAAFELRAATPEGAIAARETLMGLSSVNYVKLDWSQDARLQAFQRRMALGAQRTTRALRNHANNWPGVTPLPADNVDPRGSFSDPLLNSQWHFVNIANPGRDNNIPNTIYSTQLLSGAGVNVAFSNEGFNTYLDTDHTELDANFSQDLSMTFSQTINSENIVMTALAGILASEIDGSGIQGIAPNATFGTFNWPVFPSAIELQEYDAFDWLIDDVQIKVFNPGFYYEDPVAAYNRGSTSSYVATPFRNSFAFGRGRKGMINIFSTGTSLNSFLDILNVPAPAWPDPYNFPPTPNDHWSPLDELFNSGNASAETLTNDWVLGPYYPNGWIANYPPANDRRSFVFQTVAEDGYADIYSGQGPGVFASFYGGTTNQFQSNQVDPTLTPTNILTTQPGASNVGFFPGNADALPSGSETMSGAMVGASVIALMLEANPNLKIRDIQHILFESIQESSRPEQWLWPQWDSSRFYLGNGGGNSFWQVNTGFYTGGPITEPESIRHSDIYGFGVVDVELAIQKAANWQGVPRLVLLDTGLVGTFNDDTIDTDVELEVGIPDATFDTVIEADGSTGQAGLTLVNPGQTVPLGTICVRQNIQIESIVVELTIEGVGNEDLYITLTSPNGTQSILKMPSTNNPTGTTNDDARGDLSDDASEVIINGQAYALYRHEFLSWKHWGELSGGEWNIGFQDYGPDEPNPEGEEMGTGMMPDPGADHVINMGFFGVPGSQIRSPKTVTGYRFQIYGTDTGEQIFEGCELGTTSCPADLDGNGIIDVRDLQIYINYYLDNNAIADLDGDGVLTYNDLVIFRGLWRPGFCGNSPFTGGRPRPGNTNAGDDNNPTSRPI